MLEFYFDSTFDKMFSSKNRWVKWAIIIVVAIVFIVFSIYTIIHIIFVIANLIKVIKGKYITTNKWYLVFKVLCGPWVILFNKF